jgi:TP901 family phage tail tape measure protein
MSDFEKIYSIKFDVSKADSALEKLEKALSKIEKSGVFFQLQAISKTLVDVERNANKASKTIRNQMGRQARRDLNELGKAGKKAADGIEHIPRAANRANISLSQIGRNLNRYVLAPMAALGGLSIKAAFDINKGMANVSTLVEKTPEQLLEMKRQAQDTMVAMGKGTQDVTDGLYQVISALGESDENMGQLEKSTKAAVAGLSDTKSSVEMLTAVAKAYNDTSAKSIEHTSDLAFQTVKLGVTTFPELAASIGKVAPLAAQFNTSQEELFGTMATLTGVTGNTAEVVTQLASIYSAFMNPSEEMDKALKKINRDHREYNFTTIQSMVKTLGFKKSIELLGKEAGGSEEKLFAMFRRKEAILGILPLISSQSDNYTKKVAAMGDAAGATDEAFRKQTEGINAAGFQMEQAKQRVVVLAQRFGDRLLPILIRVLDVGEEVADWLDKVDDKTMDSAISVGKFVAEVILLVNALRAVNATSNVALALFSGIGPAASGSVAGVSALSAAVKSLAGWIGLAILAYEGLKTASDIWDQQSQPAVDKRQGDISSQNAKVDKRLKSMSLEELEAASKTEQDIITSLPVTDLSANFESRDKFMQMWHSDFSDDVERPLDQAQRERDEAIARKAKIDTQLKKRMAERDNQDLLGLGSVRGGGGFDWLGAATAGQQNSSQINMPVNVNISSGIDSRKVEKKVRDQLKKLARELESDGHSITIR